MRIIGIIDWFFTVINNALDVALPWVGLAILIGFLIFVLARDINKFNQNKKDHRENKSEMGEIFSQAMILLLIYSGGCLRKPSLGRGGVGYPPPSGGLSFV
jgi:hypothetical protein